MDARWHRKGMEKGKKGEGAWVGGGEKTVYSIFSISWMYNLFASRFTKYT